jgi:hypothetical protein
MTAGGSIVIAEIPYISNRDTNLYFSSSRYRGMKMTKSPSNTARNCAFDVALEHCLVLRVARQDPLSTDPEAMQGLLCLTPKFSVHTVHLLRDWGN